MRYKIFFNPPEFQRGRYTIVFQLRKNKPDDLILKEDFVNKCLNKAKRSFHCICTDAISNKWTFRLTAPNELDNNDCPGKDFDISTYYGVFERLVQQMEGGKTRLLVDFRTEKRRFIDVATEIKKMDDREKFQFNKDIEGNMGVPQAVELEVPSDIEPESATTNVIDLKGGQQLNEDSLVFTDGLRKWLKDNDRKFKLVKGEEGHWKLRIEKSGGEVTHEVRLVNIESIVYEPSDGLFIVLVIPNLATATEQNIDLEKETAKRERWARAPEYPDWANDCKGKE